MTHAIELKMKKRKQLYDSLDRATKTQTHESWEAYCIMRNQITQEISEAHTNYQTQIFENNTCTISKRFIKNLRKDYVGIPPLTTDGVTTSKNEDKADILNCQFFSVFTDEALLSVPSPTSSFPIMPNITFNVELSISFLMT